MADQSSEPDDYLSKLEKDTELEKLYRDSAIFEADEEEINATWLGRVRNGVVAFRASVYFPNSTPANGSHPAVRIVAAWRDPGR
jgi:hypothetical protein